MRSVATLLVLMLAGLAAVPTAVAAEQVDLLLVLAADVSRSIDTAKFQLQREGYAAAVSDPRVLEAIQSGRLGRIGLTFVEWSGVGAQRVVIDWTTVGEADSAKGFGDRLLEAPRSMQRRPMREWQCHELCARASSLPCADLCRRSGHSLDCTGSRTS